jgi:hypothetical protein
MGKSSARGSTALFWRQSSFLLRMQSHASAFCVLHNLLVLDYCVFMTAAADVKKAKEGGFYTIQSLIMNPRKVSGLVFAALIVATLVATCRLDAYNVGHSRC